MLSPLYGDANAGGAMKLWRLTDPVPVAGSELIVNGDFSSATGWTLGPGWSIGSGIATHTGGPGSIYRDAGTFGAWHSMSFDVLSISNASVQGRIGDSYSPQDMTPGAKMFTARNTRVASILGLTAAATECTVDNVSCKPLILASLISACAYSSADCNLNAAVARTSGTQAGLVARLDNPANPQNFILSYLDGAGNIKTDTCIAGVYANLAGASGAITYVAGGVPRLVIAGTSLNVYYNGVQIGTTQTVSNPALNDNKYHGKFSTYAANRLRNFRNS